VNPKETAKRVLPAPIFQLLRKAKKITREAVFWLGGLYFSHFVKRFRKNGLVIDVPYEMTDHKFRGRFVFNAYEREEAKYLTTHLDPDATILELGSCLGYISCLTNKLISNKEGHVVLEANPKLIPWIEKNKKKNACSFSIENRIISKDKACTFFIHDLIVGGSTKRTTGQKVEIEGVSIEELQKKYKLEFDTLIMDIEGGELDFFRNFQNSVKNFKAVFLEIHPFAGILTKEEALECEEILLSLGFTKTLSDNNFQVWKRK
jgi:FkbM family methyltransferase